jgi:pyruvate,water dikinase
MSPFRWLRFGKREPLPFKLLFARFRQLLDNNTKVLELFADAAEKQAGEYVFDRTYVVGLVNEIFDLVGKIVYDLNSIADQKYASLYTLVDRLRAEAIGDLAGQPVVPKAGLCIPFSQIDESQVNLVGGKSAHLGEIASRLQVPIPSGFTITTYAYLRVLEDNKLEKLIDRGVELFAAGQTSACEEVSRRLRGARLPSDLRRAVKRALGRIEREGKPLYLAVRSSAFGEDDDQSFAGQYRTLLQVKPEHVLEAYREVLASLYSKDALSYRRSAGLPLRGLMAVACMRMVQAEASGVLYTVDPNRPDGTGKMLIGATRGLGSHAVAGKQSMAAFEASRESPHRILSYRPSSSAEVVVGREDGGTHILKTEGSPTDRPELTPEQLQPLCEYALRIERYGRQPQDIEWAREHDGTTYVLQARRLQVTQQTQLPTNLAAQLGHYPVLLDHCGLVACRGIAHGPVCRLRDEQDLSDFPSGAVLVTRRASPRLASVMPRVAAIITEVGSPTGHLAALAREFRIPTIVDCGAATAQLHAGQEVTIDADENLVYQGRVDPLLQYQLVAESGFEDSAEYRLLRRLLRRITPLGLTDPQSEAFRADRCRTTHDVIRFAHEKAVEELINFNAGGGVAGIEGAKRLESELPLGLRIIDIGGGLDPMLAGASPNALVKPSALRSLPMCALWQGLTTPGVWSTQPVGVDFRTFMASAMSWHVSESSGRNLAVLSDAYLNLSLNLGYHYNMVDAYVADARGANHIYFRFVGGASDLERRVRRATMVREILERLDFAVRQSRDLVIGSARRLPRERTEDRLRALGRLIGFSRQIDALMHSEDLAMRYVDAFLRGDYTVDPGKGE